MVTNIEFYKLNNKEEKMKKLQNIGLLFASMVLIMSCNNSAQTKQETETTQEEVAVETEEVEEQPSTNRTLAYLPSVDLSGVKNMTPTELAKNLNIAINANCYDDAKISIPESPYFVQLVKRIVTNPNHWEMIGVCGRCEYNSTPMRIGTVTEVKASSWECDGLFLYEITFVSRYDQEFEMEINLYDGATLVKNYKWSN